MIRTAIKRSFSKFQKAPAKEMGGILESAIKGAEGGAEDVLRIVPLGGLEEGGRNCTFLEYKNEIVIIYMGIQFPEEETPGIDYIIPNFSYLEKKKDNVKAVIITHGHYDHIGAIPYLMGKIGNPPIYTTGLIKGIIEKRQDDFPHSPRLQFITVKTGDKLSIEIGRAH